MGLEAEVWSLEDHTMEPESKPRRELTLFFKVVLPHRGWHPILTPWVLPRVLAKKKKKNELFLVGPWAHPVRCIYQGSFSLDHKATVLGAHGCRLRN